MRSGSRSSSRTSSSTRRRRARCGADRRRRHLPQRRPSGARRLDRLDQHAAARRGGPRGGGNRSDVGPGVTRVRPGDRVVVSLLRTCGACFFCTTGAPYLCAGQFALTTENRLHNRAASRLRRASAPAPLPSGGGGPVASGRSIPPDLGLDRACLLACGVITGLGAVVDTAQVRRAAAWWSSAPAAWAECRPGRGAVGRAPDHRHRLVDGSCRRAVRRDHSARTASRTDCARPSRSSPTGRGADYVFAAIGSAPAVTQALTLLRRGGTLVLVGCRPRAPPCRCPSGSSSTTASASWAATWAPPG